MWVQAKKRGDLSWGFSSGDENEHLKKKWGKSEYLKKSGVKVSISRKKWRKLLFFSHGKN